MIEIILTLLVIAQGIVTLAVKSVKDNEIRGLKNQVKMRDDRIGELCGELDCCEWVIEDEGLDLKTCKEAYLTREDV